MSTFQELIQNLHAFWHRQGCLLLQGYDLEVGAGTSNPATFLRALGPEPFSAAYVEPVRRPTDGRYGENPNRLQHYFQYQVLLKPSPKNMQSLYLQSLEAAGLTLAEHDIRFVHDDWENPTIGAWGLGWEVWMDGMEITQYTYFQAVGGVALRPVTGELTIGLERLAMYLQKVDSVYEIQWNDQLTYGDIYLSNEIEWSSYNFEKASSAMWFSHFQDYEREATHLLENSLPVAAYDFVLKASHAFNILEAKRFFSVTERTGYIARIRALACAAAESYLEKRKKLRFPLLKNAQKRRPLPPPPLPTLPSSGEGSFLLEIGSEELPAAFVPKGMQSLKRAISDLLRKERISWQQMKSFGTPRRLAIWIGGLQRASAEQREERRGPALSTAFMEGEPTKAAEGFFRSIGRPLTSLDQLDPSLIKEIKGEKYLFTTQTTPRKSTALILQQMLPKLIAELDFPKKMYWGDCDICYARPLLWIVSLFDQEVIPFTIADLVSSNQSYGHRQLSPLPFRVDHADDYVDLLKQHSVLVDVEQREQKIEQELESIAKTLQVEVLSKERVLSQVVHLVEYPKVMTASFEKSYLSVPKEVLISEMVEHQKYFPVAKEGSLQNLFIITADTEPTESIRLGNQKVLSARLSDGAFLYAQDLKTPLIEFNEKLKQITFQKELGSLHQKVERLIQHTASLHSLLPLGDLHTLQRAALLCKADLASAMVAEFPELQGTIGRYYAIASKEKATVATAIEEHWMPRGEKDALPSTEAGILLSLAEKIDNLLGCFIVGLKPSSSSDPYALRRQALAIIRILIQGHRLSLSRLLSLCFDHFPPKYSSQKEQVLQEVESFITGKIKTVFLEYVEKDEIDAIVARATEDIYDTFCRAKALHAFRSSPSYAPLYEVFKRAKGQLRQKVGSVDPALFQERAEESLYRELCSLHPLFTEALLRQDYQQAYLLIAQLQKPLAQLFDEVKIMVEDRALCQNRLALLQEVLQLFGQLLDFSKLR